MLWHMTTRARTTGAAILIATTLPAARAAAQTLAAGVDAAPPGHVQFSFAARAGVCGDGRTYIQTAPGNFTGSINTSIGERFIAETCEPGPVRVLLDRADRQIIAIKTYVGPPTTFPATTDLGSVAPQQAADYLLDLAVRSEGRIGRDAIFPATLADGAVILDGLVAIARNQALPRETRRSALSHVGRSSEQLQTIPTRIVETLVFVARDETDNLQVRKQSLAVLGRLEHGAGIPQLIQLSRQNSSVWLSREATSVLARSGDPRARGHLRTVVEQEGLNDEALAIAIRALGQHYATPQDAALLRSVYPRLRSDKSRDAVLAAVADVGGSENVKWLTQVAKDESETTARRRKALENASRAGAPIAELVSLYDSVSNQQMKDALVNLYGRSGEPAAIDKLISIARDETNVSVRRRAISRLSRSDDPRVKEALKELITR
jgi:HEAT repeat protein